MCGRYTLTNPDPKPIALRFGLPGSSFEFDERPRFNIAPTDSVLAVRQLGGGDGGESVPPHRDLGSLRWGLLPGLWAMKGQRPLINARAETVATQPAFSESFELRRCLIPADGFYEWRRDPDGKQPIFISRPDRELFAFAGIWAELERRDEETIYSCTLITCEPNSLLAPIHNRMPVILDPDSEPTWIDPDADPSTLLSLLRPAPEDLLTTLEVADAVNNVREDGPHLLERPMKLF